MSNHAWILLVAYSVVLMLLAVPMGRYIASVIEGGLRFANRIESPLFRLCGIDAGAEMGWLKYALAILLFNAVGVIIMAF